MKKLQSIILTLTLFLFPLFFLPFTQEFFITAKLYLLGFSVLILLFLTGLEIAFSGKFAVKLTGFDLLKILLPATALLSIVIISPNKIQAILNPNYGFIALLSLIIFTFYLQKSPLNIIKILSVSGLVLSTVTIIFFVQPFNNRYLPLEFQFLRNRYFTPLGTQNDLALLLGFILIVEIVQIIYIFRSAKKSLATIFYYLLTALFTLSALVLTLYSLSTGGAEPVMPFRYSWYSFAETLKNPFNALFGIGIDNLSAAFTRVKDIAYNHSGFWQIRSFDTGRSALLHIASESGLLGLTAIGLIFYRIFKIKKLHRNLLLLPLIYITSAVLFSPPTLVLFFIFFLGLISLSDEIDNKNIFTLFGRNKTLPYLLAYLLIILVCFSGFFLYRSYLAEYYFKRSVNALAGKNGKELYDNQRKAILTNPFIERFHINFSQTNLLLAVALEKNGAKKTGREKDDILEAQKNALIHANLTVRLNPQKASNWENFAIISRNLTSVFKDAQKNSIKAYEKAILLDPQNPQYRFSLGSLYYASGDFTEAVRSFEQAVVLKSDWANAHYNLAWALYQKKDYEKAIKELEAAISLIDPKKDKLDLEKAQRDLKQLKEKQSPQPETPEQNFLKQTGTLSLPSDKPATPESNLDFSLSNGLKTSSAESKTDTKE